MEPDAPLDLAALGPSLLHAMDNADVGVTIVSAEGGVLERLYINEAGARVLGYSLSDARVLPPTLPLVPEDQARFLRLQSRGEVPRHLVCTVVASNGEHIPVEVALAGTEYGGRKVVIAFLRDIRQRKRVETALRESEARFKKLAEAAPDAIVVIGQEGFLYANPAVVSALKLKSREEFLSLRFSDFLESKDAAMMEERLKRLLAGENLPPREYRGRRSDGTTIVLEISSIAIEWEGRPAVLSYGRDVTERSRMQRQVAEHDRLAAVGTLAAGIAHEVNNPLTYLMLHLEHLKRLLPTVLRSGHDEVLSHVSEALDGAERVSTIVRELLELARPREPRKTPTQLARVCEAAVKLARPTFEGATTISLKLDTVPLIATDAARLTQVLINLLVNAAQAMHGHENANVIELKLGVESSRAVIQVLDDGPGIPPDALKNVFTPFFTTKENVRDGDGTISGMGLGLSICHSIVESLGGVIFVENRVPRGAAFRIELPLDTVSPSDLNKVTATPDANLGFKRVCVIDDDGAVANAIAGILELSLTPRQFTCPKEALEALLAEPEPYDVVLCDVLMPGLRGDELARQLVAKRPEYQHRFVFMTGAATPAPPRSAEDHHLGEVLTKPFGPTQLLRALRDNEIRRGK